MALLPVNKESGVQSGGESSRPRLASKERTESPGRSNVLAKSVSGVDWSGVMEAQTSAEWESEGYVLMAERPHDAREAGDEAADERDEARAADGRE